MLNCENCVVFPIWCGEVGDAFLWGEGWSERVYLHLSYVYVIFYNLLCAGTGATFGACAYMFAVLDTFIELNLYTLEMLERVCITKHPPQHAGR